MKDCPYCKEKVSYATLIKYSFGKGIVKEEECPHCNKIYKVTINIVFLSILVLSVLAILIFVFKPESRGITKLSIAIILLAWMPTFPFFMKLSELK